MTHVGRLDWVDHLFSAALRPGAQGAQPKRPPTPQVNISAWARRRLVYKLIELTLRVDLGDPKCVPEGERLGVEVQGGVVRHADA